MKQVVRGPSGVEVADIPAPQVGSGEVLVRVHASVISAGTETTSLVGPMELVRRDPALLSRVGTLVGTRGIRSTVELIRGRLRQLKPLGYSASGVVVQAGSDVRRFRVGDRVACGGATANHAELIAVPENLTVGVPSDVDLGDAAFAAIGSIAMQAVRRTEPTLGETILVAGLGLVGQIASQLFNIAGCHVIGADLREDRVRLAERLGARWAVGSGAGDLVETVRSLLLPEGIDAVVLCAATQKSDLVNQAFAVCRERGRVVIVGDVGMDLRRDDFYLNELDLRISRSYGPGRYDTDYEQKGMSFPIGWVRWTETRNMAEFIRLLGLKKVHVKDLVSAEYEVEDACAAYENLAAHDTSSLTCLIRYADAEQRPEAPRRTALRKRGAPSSSRLRVGVVGSGSFARGTLLPALRRSEVFHVRAIASKQGVSAASAMRASGADYSTTDLGELLDDPEIDAVVIAVPHHLHAPMAHAAVTAGKHVFVEKPLALTVKQAHELRRVVEEQQVLLTVGFNRRFAPLARKLKALLSGLRGPKRVIYRVNAEPVPKGHWIIDPERGGGRIIGEAVHFFDFFAWLLDSEPVEVSAMALGEPPEEGASRDQLTASIRFADGSLATLAYVVSGDRRLAKERIEVFIGGSSAVMEDYRRLRVGGLRGRQRFRTWRQDKGHRALVENFGKAILGEAELEITVDDGLRATQCARAVIDSDATLKTVRIE